MPRLSYKGQVVDVADSDAALIDYYLGDGAVDVSPGLVQGFVNGSTVAQVIERVGDAPVLAAAVKDAELARGDQARTTLLNALSAADEPQPGPTPDPTGA